MLQIRNKVFNDNYYLKRPLSSLAICDIFSKKDDHLLNTVWDSSSSCFRNIISHSYFPNTLEIFEYYKLKGSGYILEDSIIACFNYRGLYFSEDSFDLRFVEKPKVLLNNSKYHKQFGNYTKFGIFNKAVADHLIDVILPLLEDEPDALSNLEEFAFQEQFDYSKALSLGNDGVARKEKYRGLFTDATYINIAGLTFQECLGKLTVGKDYVKLPNPTDLFKVNKSQAINVNLPTIDYSDIEYSDADSDISKEQEAELSATINSLVNTPRVLLTANL